MEPSIPTRPMTSAPGSPATTVAPARTPDTSLLVRTQGGWRLERTQVLHRPRTEVFAFFERPENLEDITPAFLRFHIVTPKPVPMHAGAWIDYSLRLYGVPVSWRTQITRYEPGHLFVDEQKRGPFARWVHTHEFRDHPRGTWMKDTVEFAAPLGPLGRLAEALFVKRLVERIFDHRRDAIPSLLVPPTTGT